MLQRLPCWFLVSLMTIPVSTSNNPAIQLATLINSNKPVDIASAMPFLDLQAALGTLHDTKLGWRQRNDSFFDHLHFNYPEIYDEESLATEHHAFTTPVLIKRKQHGVAGYLARRLKKKTVLKKNPKVKPSRCSSLALNYNDTWASVNPRTHTWDARLRPFTPCPACRIPFQRFHALSLRPFDLTTPASDSGNIQLQTHGIHGRQFKSLKILMKRHRDRPNAMYSHKVLRQSFLHPNCRNEPAMAFAGSLRGLAFHKHQANLNEVVVGRKLWMMFPPRSLQVEPHAPCPWPPWLPNGDELSSDNAHIERILHSFFKHPRFNATEEHARRSETTSLRSCYDQNMTPLQWLVYEYPKMQAQHRPFMFVVHPGEVVWIPDDWPHATINIDDVWYVHKGSCNDQRQQRLDKTHLLQQAVQRTCDKTGRFCTEYCHAGPLCQKCNGYDDVVCGMIEARNKDRDKKEEL